MDTSERADRTPKTRVGIVGVGNWALRGHIPVLDLLPDYEIVAVQSRRREAAAAVAERFGLPHVVDTVDQLVTHPDVDLVVITTTAPQHEEGVRAAIAAGKDVYSEWPLTISTEKAEALARLARDAGVRHVVGLQRRLAPHNRYVRDLLADGYVGALRSVRMHVSMNYFQSRLSQALRWTVAPENFSNVIAIYGGHFLDMLFSSVGWPRSFSALTVNQFSEITIAETGEVLPTANPDQLVVAGTLESGAVFSVHIEGGKRNGSGVQIDITGDQGDIKITNVSAFGDVGEDYILEGAHGDNIPLETLSIPPSYDLLPASGLASSVLELANVYAAFARDAIEDTHTAPTIDDAVRMHRLIDLFAESSDGGLRIWVDEAGSRLDQPAG